MACESLAKIKCDEGLRRGCLREVRFGKFGVGRVPPLPPLPAQGLTGTGFARGVRKILMAKRLAAKIRKTKELERFLDVRRIPRTLRLSSAHSSGRSRSDVTRGCESLCAPHVFPPHISPRFARRVILFGPTRINNPFVGSVELLSGVLRTFLHAMEQYSSEP